MKTARFRHSDSMLDEMPIRVTIFMEEQMLRLGLQALLSDVDLEVDAQFPAAESDLIRILQEQETDVVVLSSGSRLTMDGVSTGGAPKLLLIVDQHEVFEGTFSTQPADGYLVRQSLTPDALGRALEQLAAGEMVIPVELGRRLIKQAGYQPQVRRSVSLTVRESETLTLLVHGLSNKQIGRRLSISEHGAKRLVSSVLLKLDVTNRTSAVVQAIKAGLVDDEVLEGSL
ncbi:LuxR C-terminal-related transcriptional regulator [Streptomyces californicus]|uniref:LuxR C-terminal-related transcriptional regulator n=1 Tax=Streptomyces californicus TaxID=67351 RepID=UPI0036CEBD43